MSILAQKPGVRLAYLPDADSDVIAEHLVAFANSEGGLIVLGVDALGRPTDPIWEEEAEGALREAASQTRPPVRTQWQMVEVKNDVLVGIRVARSTELHTLADGRILLRKGTENRPVTGPEVQNLAASKTTGEFETEVVPGATRDDLDDHIIDEYLAKREQRGAPRLGGVDDLLFEIGALTHDGEPTVAGILLFARNPQAYLPQSGLVFVRFSGREPREEMESGAGYGRRDEIGGPLARIVERAWNIVWEEMRVGARVNQLEREDVSEYPPFAVREALINAVAHRDYRIRGRRIEVRMYADRLEVISPGGLPGYITIDNLVEEHYSRNPRIVNGLFQWGYIEELGLGIDRMIEDMVQAGHPPPTFRAQPYSFTVTLENKRQPVPPKWTQSMNERQKRALTYVRDEGSITNREYQRLCPDVTAETLRRDLADLVERGILLKIGSKKGTHYILK